MFRDERRREEYGWVVLFQNYSDGRWVQVTTEHPNKLGCLKELIPEAEARGITPDGIRALFRSEQFIFVRT